MVKEVKQCRKGGDFGYIFQKMTCDKKLLFYIEATQVEEELPHFPRKGTKSSRYTHSGLLTRPGSKGREERSALPYLFFVTLRKRIKAC